MDLGRIGIWTYHLNFQPASKVREVVAELEELGYGALWVGEAAYREPLTNAGFLLSATNRMVIATGIANIWARDPFTMTAANFLERSAHSASCSSGREPRPPGLRIRALVRTPLRCAAI